MRKLFRLSKLATAFAAALLVASCNAETATTKDEVGGTPATTPAKTSPPARRAAPGVVGTPAYDFSLTDSDGNEVSLSDYKGKVVVLDFWATWCPPCRKEIPGFVALQNKYKDQGVEVVGVSLDDGWGPVRPFMKSYNVNYTIVLADQSVAGDLVAQYGNFRGIPTTFIIDREGMIRERHEGYAPPEFFEKAVQKVLKA